MKLKTVSLYDEKSLAELTRFQREKNWDFEDDIDWDIAIDLNKPLVALDENALLFPGSGQEERLAISQMMGLIIATAICEMEECLARLRKECWDDFHARWPVSPEFQELGDQFFEEEKKHSAAFRRYMKKFAEAANVDLASLTEVLPSIHGTKTEWILRNNLKGGGQMFWWIVASVEQEFLLLYHSLVPFKARLEPLYFQLHQKHFEEEVRHAPFPYLMLELLTTRNSSIGNQIRVRSDLALAEVLQSIWTINSLAKTRKVKKLAEVHPFFETLARIYPLLEDRSSILVLWQLFTSTPYVSSLVNPQSHHKLLRFAKKFGAISIPFPLYSPSDFVKY